MPPKRLFKSAFEKTQFQIARGKSAVNCAFQNDGKKSLSKRDRIGLFSKETLQKCCPKKSLSKKYGFEKLVENSLSKTLFETKLKTRYPKTTVSKCSSKVSAERFLKDLYLGNCIKVAQKIQPFTSLIFSEPVQEPLGWNNLRVCDSGYTNEDDFLCSSREP